MGTEQQDRVCKHCEVAKPDSGFYFANRNVCKPCQLAQNKTYPTTYDKAAAKKFWEERNPEKTRERKKRWRENNPQKARESRAATRFKRHASEGSFTPGEWHDLCEQYENTCLCCKKRKKLVPDHVIPLAVGGSSYIANIQPLCERCNRVKHAKVIDYRPTP